MPGQAYSLYRGEEFTLVDAERPDSSLVLTIIAGPEKAKLQLPRTLTCTMSPVVADMIHKALKKQHHKKNYGAFEHVPRFKNGVEVKDNENVLDFASEGQSRLRNPTLFLPDTSSATVKALAYWLAHPDASMLSEGEFRQMLLFDMTEPQNDYCGCGRMALFPPSGYCREHDPTIAINLLCFAEKFQLTKLLHEVTKDLLINCGVHQVANRVVGGFGFPDSVTFRRCTADKANSKTALQYFRLSVTEQAAYKGITEFTGAEYQISGLRKGVLACSSSRINRNMSFWGSFEVHFELNQVSQFSLMSRLKRALLGWWQADAGN